MASVLNALLGDAFDIVSMTQAINILPVQQLTIGQMGMFPFQGVDTDTVQIEYKQGIVTLLPFGALGSLGGGLNDPTRIVRAFPVRNIPVATTIMAHQLIGVRKFGSTDQMETVNERISEELAAHRAAHEQTWEYHRASALCGKVNDAVSGANLMNMFTEFGISEDTYTFDFSAVPGFEDDPEPEANLQAKCREVKDAVGTAAGGTGICEVGALIDDTFFNNMMKSYGVRQAWQQAQNGYDLRTKGSDPNTFVFTWGGISWARYRTAIGANNFFGGTNVARFYPMGTAATGIFQHFGAPGDSMAAVNTIGLPMYASQEVLPHDKGVQIHTSSRPFMVCKRPGTLKKGTSI